MNLLTKQKLNVFIPVFPGTNCEYESEIAYIKAGANVTTRLFLNQSQSDITQSINQYKIDIKNSKIIFIPGGFSAGDQPNGSGKFISAVFFNLESEIAAFLKKGGLLLGICNGFQALIKLGLLPFGQITKPFEGQPTLTYNDCGAHISKLVKTKVIDNNSPWLNCVSKGDVHTIPISHGEGKFICPSNDIYKTIVKNNQIKTTYLDNPNGSLDSIEGITSADGKIFGKMAHSERSPKNGYKNISNNENWDQKLFESSVQWFK